MRLFTASRAELYDARLDSAPLPWWDGLPVAGSADPDADARRLNRERVHAQQVAAQQKAQALARRRAS